MELIEAIRIFKDHLKNQLFLDQDAFEAAVPFMKLQHFPKGTIFVEEGKVCNKFGFLISGVVWGFFKDDDSEITSCLGTKNSIASSTSSMILQGPSPMTIQTLEDSDILVIIYSDLEMLYKQYPFWNNVGKIIAEKEFIEKERQYRLLSNKEGKEKYEVFIKNHPDLAKRVPLKILASFLGVRPETLSRIRRRSVNK